jgi:hypothetical protein
MELLSFTSHVGTPVEIDVCWPCHMIWFEHMESTSLSPNAVVQLFRQIQSHEGQARNLVSMRSKCPSCAQPLSPTNDIGRSGRFSYLRCPSGHGRLIAFVQFLREKQFIRTLMPQEIATLSASVAQVRCSSCGAPVDLKKDSACRHCGAAIAVLDKDAVAKALAAYDQAAAARPPRDVRVYPIAAGAADVYRQPSASSNSTSLSDLALTDLVVDGLAALITAAFD